MADNEDDPFVAGVNDNDEVIVQTNTSALLWSKEGGYALLLHPRDNMDLDMEREEMALAAVFLRLGDEKFVDSLVEWIGNAKASMDRDKRKAN